MNKNFIENITVYFKMFIDTDIIDNMEIFIECKLYFKSWGKMGSMGNSMN
jgi:hypothetical protein